MANGHGGRRPGAGRKPGSRDKINRFTRARELQAEVTEFLKTNDAAIFEGDSLELAVSIYKNENMPLGLRLHALGLALPFERPRLTASATVTKHIDGDDAAFGRLFAQIEQRLALAPASARDAVIDMLREGEGAGERRGNGADH
jgi:hypothetical protein